MIESPKITRSEEQVTAFIHVTIPREEIQKVMGPAMSEVSTVIAAQGLAAAGPWFTHHLKLSRDFFDFEVGVPVRSAVTESGRVKPGRLPP